MTGQDVLDAMNTIREGEAERYRIDNPPSTDYNELKINELKIKARSWDTLSSLMESCDEVIYFV